MRTEARFRAASGSRRRPAGSRRSLKVAAVKDDDVDVASEAAMLEAVVEQMEAWGRLLALGKCAGRVAV